jgi:hypothetical protein
MKRAIPGLALLFILIRAAHADPQIVTDQRTVPDFRAIEIAGTFEVDIAVGKPTRLEITGDATLVNKVTAKMRDGVLVLDLKERRRNDEQIHVVIGTPALTSLSVTGTAKLSAVGIAGPSFNLQVPGTGQVQLSGTTDQLRLSVDGTGQVVAKQLAARDVLVDIRGTGQATIRVAQSLDARISGTGAISCASKPQRVRSSVTGTGAINCD